MKTYIALIVTFLLVGCATTDTYISSAEKVNDEVLNNIDTAYCQLPKLGPLYRKYKDNPEGLYHRLRACGWADSEINNITGRATK